MIHNFCIIRNIDVLFYLVCHCLKEPIIVDTVNAWTNPNSQSLFSFMRNKEFPHIWVFSISINGHCNFLAYCQPPIFRTSLQDPMSVVCIQNSIKQTLTSRVIYLPLQKIQGHKFFLLQLLASM